MSARCEGCGKPINRRETNARWARFRPAGSRLVLPAIFAHGLAADAGRCEWPWTATGSTPEVERDLPRKAEPKPGDTR